MDEALEKAERVFGAPTRLGLVRNIETRDISFKNPVYSAAVGLLMDGCEDEDSFAYRPNKINRLKKILASAKTVYKEYF